MRKMAASCLALLALLAVARAGDAWKEKPYQQWDEKDVTRILRDSPWAKQIMMDAPWLSSRESADSGSEGGQPPVPAGSGGGYGGKMGGMQTGTSASPPPGAGAAAPSGVARVPFWAAWHSSRTIREALARQEILQGAIKQADAEKFLAQEPADYVLVVYGPDMAPFADAEESALKQNAYLELKKSKQKLEASKVEFQRDASGKNVFAVLFSFPKKDARGQATIPPGEKGIEFFCRAGKSAFQFSFDSQKMVDQQGRDL